MISVPIAVFSLTEENIATYIEQMKTCGVGRVFLCGLGYSYSEDFVFNRERDLEVLKRAISEFRAAGFEIGLWSCAFGHGGLLYSNDGKRVEWKYRSIVGADGNSAKHALCPRDKNLKRDFFKGLKALAALKPDIILLDDDFRLNDKQGYNFGCFCEECKERFDEIVGEKVEHTRLEELIFTGGKNKYRDAYMTVSKESLMSFAREARAAIDEIDPNIRFATCTTPSHFDVSGTDVAELARAMAGKNKPFTRICGAPYIDPNLIRPVEMARMYFSWLDGLGVEVVSEGDVYPRPRYNASSSSKALELFNLILAADGRSEGRHDYIVDYYFEPNYETGYVERYVKNNRIMEQIGAMFSGKRDLGVRVISTMHKFADTVLPDTLTEGVPKLARNNGVESSAADLLSKNSIPTTYTGKDLPIFVCGQSAMDITEEDLRFGAILDVSAAEILKKRGIDTGLISLEKRIFDKERFITEGGCANVINNDSQYAVKISEKAEIISEYLPDATPSSYRYENEKGQKFFVICYDQLLAKRCYNFTNSYYRQKTLFEAIEWMSGKPLPVKSYKNPGLYTMAKGAESSLSVLLVNVNLDDVIYPTFTLDKEYNEIRFINAEGRLEGNKVIIESDIPAYGYAGFEVK